MVAVLALTLSAAAFGQDSPSNPCGDKAMHGGSESGLVFQINDPMGRNSVTFKSSAPLEDIVGTTSDITGTLYFDPTNPKKGGHGQLTVSVASLNTGIPLRDDHLKSADWLDANRYPEVALKIKKVEKVKSVKSTESSDTYDVTVHADFTLRGKTRSIEFPGRFSYLRENDKTSQRLPGDLLAARANFSVALKDYGVTGPEGMDIIGSKVGKAIDVEVSFVGNTAVAMAGNPCGEKASAQAENPCGAKAVAGAGNPCGSKAAANPCGGKAAKNAGNPCSY